MPTLSGSLTPQGAMIDVKLMQSPRRVAAKKRANQPFAQPVIVRALIDTGAGCSALDRNVITQLDLSHHGVAWIHTPSTGLSLAARNTYDVFLILGEGSPNPLTMTIPVVESDFASEGFYVLIGRDVLARCVLTYNGPQSLFELRF